MVRGVNAVALEVVLSRALLVVVDLDTVNRRALRHAVHLSTLGVRAVRDPRVLLRRVVIPSVVYDAHVSFLRRIVLLCHAEVGLLDGLNPW